MRSEFLISLLMLFICLTTGCVNDSEPSGPALEIGDKLPEFSVSLNNGTLVTTASLAGKIPVIVFFNTNCPDCQKELPVIEQLYLHYAGDPVVDIMAIAREEQQEEIAEYWADNNLTIPYSPQADRKVYNLFAPNRIPRIYIADTRSVIVAAYDDSDMPGLEQLISDIESLRNSYNEP